VEGVGKLSYMMPKFSRGGIRNKKVVAFLEKQIYPDMRKALAEVSHYDFKFLVPDNRVRKR
jgi:hypothetical protein